VCGPSVREHRHRKKWVCREQAVGSPVFPLQNNATKQEKCWPLVPSILPARPCGLLQSLAQPVHPWPAGGGSLSAPSSVFWENSAAKKNTSLSSLSHARITTIQITHIQGPGGAVGRHDRRAGRPRGRDDPGGKSWREIGRRRERQERRTTPTSPLFPSSPLIFTRPPSPPASTCPTTARWASA